MQQLNNPTIHHSLFTIHHSLVNPLTPQQYQSNNSTI
jgi:hypothetical protein